ncbi:hypothetical protein [Streptomyces sp. SHP 1-2]|uniref:hypothetical protein n=1 Tax=Streptomyces sp. SHP 1-2 TaxID=2769489 RepID=UPI002238EBCB|nr:hypothetical protein [Streptomyces sp. SHP 1-2]MCW5249137.1 hypothetical protein [Streptomyces sp. SHP 1-2]
MTSGTGVILVDTATGSQAWTERSEDGRNAYQHGPLLLRDRVEDALTAQRGAGSPPHSAPCRTVAPDGTRRGWLPALGGRSRDLPV